ncbi:hypothetical protein MMC16_000721 [Acarospora aff. strigata]|nr:hypothetical protein [Acarospora aff. strigata]
MKNIAVLTILATLTAAAPFAKRDIVWVTVTEEVTEIVDATTTIWVNALPTSVEAAQTAAASTTTTQSALENQFFEHASSPTSSSPTSSSDAVPVTSATTTPAPVDTATPPPPSPAASSSSSSSSAYVPPPASAASATTEASSSTYVPPAPPTYATPTPVESTSPAPASAPAQPTSAPSSNGDCSPSSPCTGDLTNYTAGMGACGVTNNGQTDSVIALPASFMGEQSNGNPLCGKSVTIKYKGITATAKVADKCPECQGRSIDLSEVLFKKFAALSDGRLFGAEWSFN